MFPGRGDAAGGALGGDARRSRLAVAGHSGRGHAHLPRKGPHDLRRADHPRGVALGRLPDLRRVDRRHAGAPEGAPRQGPLPPDRHERGPPAALRGQGHRLRRSQAALEAHGALLQRRHPRRRARRHRGLRSGDRGPRGVEDPRHGQAAEPRGARLHRRQPRRLADRRRAARRWHLHAPERRGPRPESGVASRGLPEPGHVPAHRSGDRRHRERSRERPPPARPPPLRVRLRRARLRHARDAAERPAHARRAALSRPVRPHALARAGGWPTR